MWHYDLEQRKDLGERRTATVVSLAPLYIAGRLGNPALEVIVDATLGSLVRVRLHAGQMDPRSGRKVEARVDDGDPLVVPASHPEGEDAVLSLRKPRELIAAIASGRMLYLRVPVYQQGEVKMAFDIGGLDQARLKVAPLAA